MIGSHVDLVEFSGFWN